MVLVVAGVAAAHDPSASHDEHAYMVMWGDVLVACPYGPDHPGPFNDFEGWGGTCFDFGTDVRGGTGFRFSVQDTHGHPIGGIMRVVTSSNSILVPNTPYCGSHPADGSFAELPVGAYRLWIWTMAAQSPVNCLVLGNVGLPATTGTITIETI